MKNDINVAVYDFEWRKLSLCRSIEEAARVYELPAKYIKESICKTKDYSPELIKEKFRNSKIVKLLKQKNVFNVLNNDVVI